MTVAGKWKVGALLACVAVAGVASCQIVAGVQSRKLDPVSDGCPLPTGTGPQVRIANFAPTGDMADVCLRPAGGSWGHTLLLEGGQSCQQGFQYSGVSIAFSAPASTIDAKLVRYGVDCTNPDPTQTLAEIDAVSLQSPGVTTIALIGGAQGAPEQLVALPEETAVDSSHTRLRFGHFAPGLDPLYFGTSSSSLLPSNVVTVLVPGPGGPPIKYGTVPGAQQGNAGSVDADGYFGIIPAGFDLVAAPQPTASAIFDYAVPANQATYSIFAIGLPRDNQFPLQALVVNEDPRNSPDATYPQELARSGPNQLCFLSALPSLSLDVLNPALYGPNAPQEAARRQPVVQAINNNRSDAMCIVEVDRAGVNSDQSLIISGSKGTYPYSYTISTDLTTPFPPAQSGQVPPAPTQPYCPTSDSTLSGLVDTALQCAIQNCSTTKDASGILPGSTSCLSQQCTEQFAPLLSSYAACFDCLIDNIASLVPYSTTKTACQVNTQVPMGWNGTNSSMVLSRFPIVDQDYFVLPSTNFRRAVLYTRLQLEDMSTFDYYCGFFISPFISADLPYDGFYGGDAGDSTSQYEQENQLEAQDLISFVKKKSGTTQPAIIMGEWRSSIATTQGYDGGALLGPDGGPTQTVDNSNQQTLLMMGKSSPVVPGGFGPFNPVLAPDFTPQCNYCPAPENPYNTGNLQNLFVLQPFLYNWPGDPTKAAIDESLTFTGSTKLADGTMGPISPYFGVNIRIQRPNHQ